jgi:hypothetical protein
MTKAYFSTVLDASADEVWSAVRDFGSYSWAGSEYSAVIEANRAGDAIGTVRRVGADGAMRQRLVAMSDPDRWFSYEVCAGSPIEVDKYRATLRVTPVVDTGRAFVEWWATFDCPPADSARWQRFYAEDRFPTWIDGLRHQLTRP